MFAHLRCWTLDTLPARASPSWSKSALLPAGRCLGFLSAIRPLSHRQSLPLSLPSGTFEVHHRGSNSEWRRPALVVVAHSLDCAVCELSARIRLGVEFATLQPTDRARRGEASGRAATSRRKRMQFGDSLKSSPGEQTVSLLTTLLACTPPSQKSKAARYRGLGLLRCRRLRRGALSSPARPCYDRDSCPFHGECSSVSVPQVEIGWAEGPPSPTLPPKEQSPNSNGNDQLRDERIRRAKALRKAVCPYSSGVFPNTIPF